MRFLCVLLLLIPSLAWGEITVPIKVKVGQKIPAFVNAEIPEGAVFDGGWNVETLEGDGSAETHPLKEDNGLGIWAPNGKYRVKFSGFWILLEEVTIVDKDGNERIIKSYLGHGSVEESASFEVVGGPDPPDPPTPPSPGGPWRIVLFYRSQNIDNLPPGKRALLRSLEVRNRLHQQGHELLEVIPVESLSTTGVPQRLAPFLVAVDGESMPRVAVAPKDGNDSIVHFAMPDNYDGLIEVLNGDELERLMRR